MANGHSNAKVLQVNYILFANLKAVHCTTVIIADSMFNKATVYHVLLTYVSYAVDTGNANRKPIQPPLFILVRPTLLHYSINTNNLS